MNFARSTVCAQQIQVSQDLKSHLQTSLTSYDEFIYIGHSRLGLGLGLGPFKQESTFEDFKFFNKAEAGRKNSHLKR